MLYESVISRTAVSLAIVRIVAGDCKMLSSELNFKCLHGTLVFSGTVGGLKGVDSRYIV